MPRTDKMTSFMVMDMLAESREYADTIHFEVGEPDLPPSPRVLEALERAVKERRLGYTESMGILPLREKIAEHYTHAYGIKVSPDRVLITLGTSGAFLVAYGILLSAGDRIGMPDPGYPCYKNFAWFLDAEPVFVPVDAAANYEIAPARLDAFPGLKALHVPSPSNPLGSVYSETAFRDLVEGCESRGVRFISDEIYHGLVYSGREHTAREYSERAVVINSFSKLHALPGLRIGWMILPPDLVRAAEIVIQNTSISVPTLSQYACLEAFDYVYMEEARQNYRKRRDYLYGALKELFTIDAKPDGAFYLWADVSRWCDDSTEFCRRLLEDIHVAVAPGEDFGANRTNRYVRFSYARELAHMEEGVERLRNYLMKVKGPS